jgi:hypothetical protein
MNCKYLSYLLTLLDNKIYETDTERDMIIIVIDDIIGYNPKYRRNFIKI